MPIWSSKFAPFFLFLQTGESSLQTWLTLNSSPKKLNCIKLRNNILWTRPPSDDAAYITYTHQQLYLKFIVNFEYGDFIMSARIDFNVWWFLLQLDEDVRVLLQRFDAEGADEAEQKS